VPTTHRRRAAKKVRCRRTERTGRWRVKLGVDERWSHSCGP